MATAVMATSNPAPKNAYRDEKRRQKREIRCWRFRKCVVMKYPRTFVTNIMLSFEVTGFQDAYEIHLM